MRLKCYKFELLAVIISLVWPIKLFTSALTRTFYYLLWSICKKWLQIYVSMSVCLNRRPNSQTQWTRIIWHGACCGRLGVWRMNSDTVSGSKAEIRQRSFILEKLFFLPAWDGDGVVQCTKQEPHSVLSTWHTVALQGLMGGVVFLLMWWHVRL